MILASPALVSTLGTPTRANLVRVSNSPSHTDEKALVARAANDADAMAELYRRYLPRVHDFAYRRTGSVQAAEDICSATFEAAMKSIGDFRWRRGGFAPWIFRIASRQTIAYFRTENRAGSERGQQAMSRLSSGHAPPADVALADGDGRLRAALHSIKPRYQEAIALRRPDPGPEGTSFGTRENRTRERWRIVMGDDELEERLESMSTRPTPPVDPGFGNRLESELRRQFAEPATGRG